MLAAYVEIDHIVHKGLKTGHPEFTFTLKNLAAACKDCNNVKGRKTVLANTRKKYVRYPYSTASYVWVHPYLHNYSEHLEIFEGWVYKSAETAFGPSKNGQAVIKKCGLDKISHIEKANRISKFEQAKDAGAIIREALAQTNNASLEAVAKEIAPLLEKSVGARAFEFLEMFRAIHLATQALLVVGPKQASINAESVA